MRPVLGREEAGFLPGDVESDLGEMQAELADYAEKDVLKVAAYFHARFEHIHPFADGNGRVGRTLMNYYLMIHGHPPIIIHDERKAEYNAALERYNREEDGSPLYTFRRD